MAPEPRAVLLDSFGTLLALDAPVPRLREQLAERGFDVDGQLVARAFGAEVAYYVAHHLEGRDQSTLAELRNRCAAVMLEALGTPELSLSQAREALMAALSFRAFPDAAPALRDLRGRGIRLVVVSNWDCSLRAVLDSAGLLELVDEAVSSAEAGAAKPDPALFHVALQAIGCEPDEALHVGDSEQDDVRGAAAAGVRAVMLRRAPGGPDPGVPVISGLGELAAVL